MRELHMRAKTESCKRETQMGVDNQRCEGERQVRDATENSNPEVQMGGANES